MSKYGNFPPIAIWGGKYWALITSVFVHRELLHFAFNLYWLWVLGGALERVIGPLRLLAFFVMSAIVSSGVEFAVSGSTGIGASGVVYAIFGFLWIASDRVEAFKKAVPRNRTDRYGKRRKEMSPLCQIFWRIRSSSESAPG